jgi:hypothetical protein
MLRNSRYLIHSRIRNERGFIGPAHYLIWLNHLMTSDSPEFEKAIIKIWILSVQQLSVFCQLIWSLEWEEMFKGNGNADIVSFWVGLNPIHSSRWGISDFKYIPIVFRSGNWIVSVCLVSFLKWWWARCGPRGITGRTDRSFVSTVNLASLILSLAAFWPCDSASF